MNRIFGYLAVLAAMLSAPVHEAFAQKDRYMIEAEAFQFKGKWFAERSADCMGSSMLRLGGGGSLDATYDALTAVRIYRGRGVQRVGAFCRL